MKILLIILLIFFSSNLYAGDVLLRPSERNTMLDLLADKEGLKGREQSYHMRCVGFLVTYLELMKEEFDIDLPLRTDLTKEMYKIGLEIMYENLSNQNKTYLQNIYNDYILQYIEFYKEDMLKNKETNGVFFIADNYLNDDASICLDYQAAYRKFDY